MVYWNQRSFQSLCVRLKHSAQADLRIYHFSGREVPLYFPSKLVAPLLTRNLTFNRLLLFMSSWALRAELLWQMQYFRCCLKKITSIDVWTTPFKESSICWPGLQCEHVVAHGRPGSCCKSRLFTRDPLLLLPCAMLCADQKLHRAHWANPNPSNLNWAWQWTIIPLMVVYGDLIKHMMAVV